VKLQEILLALAEPIDPSFLSKRTQAKQEILYISWPDLIALLQQRAGIDGFSWEIKDSKQIGERFVMVGRLTIYGEDGHRSMDATGQEVLNCSSYGDPSSNAEAMALRRACAKFGLGLSLWQKEETASLLQSMNEPKPVDSSDYTKWKSPEEGIKWASKELDLPQSQVKALWEAEGKPTMKTGAWTVFVRQRVLAKAAVDQASNGSEAELLLQSAIADKAEGEALATLAASVGGTVVENPFG
jgi:hypothetical protein